MLPRIALLGATEPLGEALIALLSERELDAGALIALAIETEEDLVALAGEEVPVEPVATFDWSRADILVSVLRGAAAQRVVAEARTHGLSVIALEQAADALPGAEVVDNGVALALARVLAPVVRAAGLVAVDVSANLPVSMAGRAAVEELAHQTQAVFTMAEPECEVFPVRMAFNLLPQVGQALATGETDWEAHCRADLRTRLGQPDLRVQVSAAWAPVFYGCAIVVHAVAGAPLTRARLSGWLAAQDEVTVMDEAMPGGAPTPYTEAQESEGIFVGRVRVENDHADRFALWLVCDAMRLEAAQIVDRLENMIEKKAK